MTILLLRSSSKCSQPDLPIFGSTHTMTIEDASSKIAPHSTSESLKHSICYIDIMFEADNQRMVYPTVFWPMIVVADRRRRKQKAPEITEGQRGLLRCSPAFSCSGAEAVNESILRLLSPSPSRHRTTAPVSRTMEQEQACSQSPTTKS